MIYSFLIIGGGIHGVFHAGYLLRECGLSEGSIKILDPGDNLLGQWAQQTRNCGMSYLRSNSSHCLHTDFRSLRMFAKKTGCSAEDFLQPYSRPSLDLFMRYSRSYILQHRLEQIHMKVKAERITKDTIYSVSTGTETLYARNIILCPGRSIPRLPSWVSNRDSRTRYIHVLNPDVDVKTELDRLTETGKTDTAVIGGGISGVNLALSIIENYPALHVDLFNKNDLNICLFDFDPGFVGPKKLDRFHELNENEKRKSISAARNKGSIPAEIAEKLIAQLETGRIRLIQQDAGRTELTGNYDLCVFASGFHDSSDSLPEIIRQTALNCQLLVDNQGFPVLDDRCQWNPGLFVSGAAAQTGIGPAAPNIIGAHLASRRMKLCHQAE
ncbi:FAD/NAD(P)-binding protein [Spirochaeta dissipatitropha]